MLSTLSHMDIHNSSAINSRILAVYSIVELGRRRDFPCPPCSTIELAAGMYVFWLKYYEDPGITVSRLLAHLTGPDLLNTVAHARRHRTDID